jgi:bcr-type benzoyl-CoA reductase subunit C
LGGQRWKQRKPDVTFAGVKTRGTISFANKESFMEAATIFHEVVDNPEGYAKEWKARTGKKVVGYFCSYVPEEIITAAGALPFRIFGGGCAVSRADSHLQAYSCSLVRGGLEDALAGKLDFLAGTVFAHTCDSIQRLSDIWRMNIKGKFHLDIILPVKLNTDSARDYMTATFRRFREDLGQALQVEIDDRRLVEAVAVHNRIRAGLQSLYQLRLEKPDAVTAADIHTVFRAGMIMDRRDFAQALELLIDAVADAPRGVRRRRRLVLTGGLCSVPDIHHLLEASGGAVVWDDSCTGARYFEGIIAQSDDPVDAIARRYLERVVCPAKHAGLDRRGEHLLDMVREKKAEGVIFIFLKFCDPHAFDYPYLKALLDQEQIPTMLFEIEDRLSSEGQIRTRCEAFVEML